MISKKIMKEKEFIEVMDSVNVWKYIKNNGMVDKGVENLDGNSILMVNGESEKKNKIEVYGVN